nr:amidohydrolase [uncultured Dysosmobacter sp.]
MERHYLTADTVITNGRVLTVDAQDTVAEAVAIRGKYILDVGSAAEMAAYVDEHTKVIDAGGKTVMPGFIDTHIHAGMYGLLDHGIINVVYPKVHSIADIQQLIREDAAKKKPGEWIKLNGYDHNKLAEKRHPTKEELDEAAPNHPVQLTRCCAHMGVYNTLALKMAGVERADQFAPGEVVLNPDGTLHGLLKETAHMSTSTKVEFSHQELVEGYANASKILLALGVTTAHDAGAWGTISTRAMQDACLSGEAKVRINMMVFDMFGKESGKDYIRDFIRAGVFTGCGGEHYKIGPVKIMLDGSSSGPSSAVIEGYSHDPDNHGIQVWTQEEADEIILEAHRAGFQVTAHAVGDKAVTIIVNAIEKALAQFPRADCRHRIEHCGLTNPELIARIAKLGIVPISNPSFITINGTDYNRYYGDRVRYMFPLKSYLDAGVITAIGSDSPVTHPDPMNSLYGALNRKDRKTGDDVGENQKVEVLQIVRMMTYNGAYASFEEKLKGSLEPGKLADVVILTEDLLTYPPEDVQQVAVRATFLDGELVYEKT